MDELVGRLVANGGLDRTVAEKAVGIILQFLLKEGPSDKVRALITRLPGAEAAMMAAGEESGGMFSMGGIMGVGTKLMGIGLSMGQVQGVAKEVIAFAREKAGEDTIGEIVGAIPGLSQFV
jgi:methyl coenzyme M reductase beta subunit